MMDGFVHLHVHSHYSLLDGAIRIPDLVARTRTLGMDAVALTDHGNLFGAVEFYCAAKEAGVKPILGMEAYISPTTRDDRTMGNIATACYHLLLLATDKTGWSNLMKLSSRAYMEGFYYRPRLDRRLLSDYGDGLICTTACLGGEVPAALLAGRIEKAGKIAGEYRDIFGPERFFIELQNQDLPEQRQLNPQLVELARTLGVGIVGTNDVHFLKADDKPAHEVLTCISTGKTLAGGGAMPYSPQLYLKGPAEMHQALGDWPGAAANTLKIAEMCTTELDFRAKHLPVFQSPDGSTPTEHLRKIANEGLARRFGEGVTDEHRRRLARELDVIEAKKYSSYVLIVHDFVRYARANGIPCGARGSGCATLMGYCLGISDVDPMKYGLLFERFTDPQREEDPDFDIDICQDGRAKVIQYVREKYGHVAQVITYGTLKARAAIRDVGRVMDMPLAEVDAIAKKIPDALGTTIDSALEAEPDLRRMVKSDQRVEQLITHARSLEGLARHAGVHAAAVLVADEPLENFVPLCKQADGEEAITQWDGETCAFKAGLMKIDFLGLRTLTIIQRARQLVADSAGLDIDPEQLPLDDQEVFELFRQGATDGVFQFESGGMKSVLVQMQPTRIEDLIAANAMYRPGPMELIGSYCARKNGLEQVPSLHPLVDDILSETYGIMCYQEQVMQVVHRLGKLQLNTALTLIKAISKKKRSVIRAERSRFIEGAKENGIDHDEAEALFELIQKFAGYGFNKAHSTRYAILAYQAAYFKTHWPLQFLAATLTLESRDTDKVVQYISEAQRMGVTIAPPDINACGSDFAVDGRQVRFGLAAVKGVGARAVEAIVAARRQVGNFRDLYHFCANVDLRAVNRATIEALIKCGAFDSLGAHRAAMIAALDTAVQVGQAAADARRNGQMDLFGADEKSTGPPRFPGVPPWSEAQLLAAEKETLGFYITSHPLTHHARRIDGLSRPQGVSIARLGEFRTDIAVTLGCMVCSLRQTLTKTGRSAGRKMAMLTIEDLTGKCNAVVFAETYERVASVLQEGAIVFVQGRLDRRRDIPSIIVEDVIPIEQATEQLTGTVRLHLGTPSCPQKAEDGHDKLVQLRDLLSSCGGACEVQFELRPATRSDVRVALRAGRQWFITPSPRLVDKLSKLLGDENLSLQAKPPAANGGGANNRSRGRNGVHNYIRA